MIYHGMTSSYYRVLLSLRDQKGAERFVNLLEKAPKLKALADKTFAALVGPDAGAAPEGDGEHDLDNSGVEVLALELEPAEETAQMNTARIWVRSLIWGLGVSYLLPGFASDSFCWSAHLPPHLSFPFLSSDHRRTLGVKSGARRRLSSFSNNGHKG
jgi:hypothetical protein